MKRILEFFQDGDKQLSSTRLNTIAWSFTMIGLVIFTTVKHGDFPKVDNSLLTLTALFLGVKFGQNLTEALDSWLNSTKSTTTDNTTTPPKS